MTIAEMIEDKKLYDTIIDLVQDNYLHMNVLDTGGLKWTFEDNSVLIFDNGIFYTPDN